jgi:hypothetical protein
MELAEVGGYAKSISVMKLTMWDRYWERYYSACDWLQKPEPTAVTVGGIVWN